MSTIVVENLTKVFGARTSEALPLLEQGLSKEEILKRTGCTVALRGVSLTVEPGETFVVMGLSGSGKSTFVRCLNRLIEPTSGSIAIEDVDLLALGDKEVKELRRSKMAMVFQRFGLFPHRTVIENVSYGLKVQGASRSKRNRIAQHWIDVVGLSGYEHVRPSGLSGGMQQRVGLARALATDPKVLLMDEAFSALDPLIRREMQEELIRLQRELGKTIVFITHDLDEALRLGDRVAILNAGELVQVGTPEAILRNPADDYVAAFVRDVDRSRVLTARHALEPALQARLREAPKDLLPRLQAHPGETAFVVDANGRYQGTVTQERVRHASLSGQGNLAALLEESAPTVSEDTELRALLPLCADSRVPVAVLGAGDKLAGVVSRRTLLSVLSEGNDAGDERPPTTPRAALKAAEREAVRTSAD